MLSDEVRLHKVVGLRRMPYTRLKCRGSIKTLIMWDSPENLYMMEQNFIVDQQFQAKEEVTQ
jgi:hypothetical protein